MHIGNRLPERLLGLLIVAEGLFILLVAALSARYPNYLEENSGNSTTGDSILSALPFTLLAICFFVAAFFLLTGASAEGLSKKTILILSLLVVAVTNLYETYSEVSFTISETLSSTQAAVFLFDMAVTLCVFVGALASITIQARNIKVH